MTLSMQQCLDCLHPVVHAETPKISMGCPVLDRTFNGGVPCGSITEIVCESGMGKTQMASQLCFNIQLPPNHGGMAGVSLYLHMEFPFPFRRLHQLAFHRSQLNHNPFDKIFIQPLYSLDTLEDVLPRMEAVVPRLNIKLIVIDSVAALFRGAFDHNPTAMKERLNKFFKISVNLRQIANKFVMSVVVKNQVTNVIANSNVFRIGEWLTTFGRNVSATLGMSWVNCVNTRLFMSCVGKKNQGRKRQRGIYDFNKAFPSCVCTPSAKCML